jgi:hypothetical protein
MKHSVMAGRGSMAALLAMVAACSASDSGPVDFQADTGGEAVAQDAPRVVARLATGEGATVTFYNERAPGDDPVISIAIASPESTPAIDALLAQKPSALELYRAIVPGKPAPDELVREHRLLAKADSAYALEPRVLAATSVAGSNTTEAVTCGTFSDWKKAFGIFAQALDGEYTAIENASTSGYVGYAPKFYFDVCRTSSSMWAWGVSTDRRSNASVPWAVFNSGSPLGGNQRYRFFRNTFTCSSFQYRLFVDAVFGGTYYRGATWADEWSCQITAG